MLQYDEELLCDANENVFMPYGQRLVRDDGEDYPDYCDTEAEKLILTLWDMWSKEDTCKMSFRSFVKDFREYICPVGFQDGGEGESKPKKMKLESKPRVEVEGEGNQVEEVAKIVAIATEIVEELKKRNVEFSTFLNDKKSAQMLGFMDYLKNTTK